MFPQIGQIENPGDDNTFQKTDTDKPVMSDVMVNDI
jgi:hypothetical protein